MQKMSPEKKEKIMSRIKKLGLIGFLFFFLKGMAWLTLGYFVFK